LRRRNHPAVGPDRRLKVRPRNAGVSGCRSRRWVESTLASTASKAERGDKGADNWNAGKAETKRTRYLSANDDENLCGAISWFTFLAIDRGREFEVNTRANASHAGALVLSQISFELDMESDLIPTWGRRRESAFVWDRSHHR
jgi:hypothetical protein